MIIRDESIEDYHAHDAVSNSGFKDLDDKGPFAFLVRHVQHKGAWTPTEAQLEGQAFEDFLCGVSGTWAHRPDGLKLATKAGKEWAAEQKQAGLTVLPAGTAERFERMRASVLDLAIGKELIDTSEQQVTLRMKYEGIPGIQSRPDFARFSGEPAFTDLKTVANLGTFERDVLKYGYHRQAAIVRMLARNEFVDRAEYRLLAVEKAFPNRAQTFRFNRTFLDIGERWVMRQIDKLQDHFAADFWPKVTEEEVIMSPPKWLEGEAS